MRRKRSRVVRNAEKYRRPKVSNKVEKRVIYGKIGIINRNMIHERMLAKQIGGDVIRNTVGHLKRYNVIILLAPHRAVELKNIRKIKMKYRDIKIILWWIGSDVMALSKGGNIRSIPLLRGMKAQHISVSNGLKEELLKYKIRSSVLPLVPECSMDDVPLPEDYTVAVYMPSHKTDFYNLGSVIEIAKKTPDVKYILYGNKGSITTPLPPNMEAVGWVNGTKSVIEKTNMLLRLVDHDGFSKGVIEFFSNNRYVISNQNYPHSFDSANISDIADKINTHPKAPKEAVDYYRREFSVENFKKKLMRFIDAKG